MLTVKRAITRASDEKVAAREIAEQLRATDTALALVFASWRKNCDELIRLLSELLDPIPVVGCTTAGELGPDGFVDDCVVGLSLASEQLRVGYGMSNTLASAPLAAGREAALSACSRLELEATELDPSKHVALTLIDGRSMSEESFVAGVAATLEGIDIVGGSASDDYREPRCSVFCCGKAHRGAAVVILLEIEDPFVVLVHEHLVPTDKRVVVTESEPATRTVYELNGRPAREVYEEILGEPVTRELANRSPFAQKIDNRFFIRSVLDVGERELRFACAIENGVVLYAAKPGDMLASTEHALRQAKESLGTEVVGLLAFHCLGRYVEAQSLGIDEQLGRIFSRYPVIGFNTFGEQIGALHVNHTLTGLVLGSRDS